MERYAASLGEENSWKSWYLTRVVTIANAGEDLSRNSDRCPRTAIFNILGLQWAKGWSTIRMTANEYIEKKKISGHARRVQSLGHKSYHRGKQLRGACVTSAGRSFMDRPIRLSKRLRRTITARAWSPSFFSSWWSFSLPVTTHATTCTRAKTSGRISHFLHA